MKILLGITGASGSIYGIRLLEELVKLGNEVHLIVSEDAKEIIKHETNYAFDKIKNKASFYYKNSDMFAPPSSGSFKLDAMVIVPCSMKTLSAIANGYCDTLISRAATCFLKEERKLVLVIRETPLDLPSIKNMLSAKQAGATILPAMPGFYHKPKKIEELVNYIVGKTLDQLRIDNSIFKRWK
jgi:4-hydroxy-3-polyprenylbenzoate decarboxylase